MTPHTALELFAVPGLPMVRAGDDLAALIADGLAGAHRELRRGDVLVVAQKIVSKSEGRLVELAAITPPPPPSNWRPKSARIRAWSR